MPVVTAEFFCAKTRAGKAGGWDRKAWICGVIRGCYRNGRAKRRPRCRFERSRLSARRISLFEQSRSDRVMLAVGLSPRDNGRERLRVAERRLNRNPNQALQASLRDAWFSRSPPVG